MYNLEILKQQEPIFLERDHSGKGYICPVCGSGSGKNGTGIKKNPRNPTQYKCFACGTCGSVIDWYAIHEGKESVDDKTKIESCFDYFMIDRLVENKQEATKKVSLPKPQQEDYTNFLLQSEKNNDYKYLESRGISKKVQKMFHIGYVANWVNPNAVKTTIERGGNPNNIQTSPRCIIPRSRYSYLARDTRNGKTGYEKLIVGNAELLNLKALDNSKVIFVVEGEIDCMSIYEAGGEACALCSTSNINKFLEHLKKNKRNEQLLILMLDNDNSGKSGTEKLKTGLCELGIEFKVANYTGKDPNEFLMKDRKGLEKMISSISTSTGILNEDKEKYLKNSTAYYLKEFIDGITDSANTQYIPTGFKGLDKVLDGGLYEGLYIVGAISSLGKTTLVLQIADQIAQAGIDVLIFSLEMARTELMSKSISRITYLNKDSENDAKTARGITTGSRYKDYNDREKRLINEAIEIYGKYAGNIYIHEGIGDIGTDKIKDEIKHHIQFTEKKPVVFVDYIQILAPCSERYTTDKQNTDKAVLELKRISRDFKLPVIGVSSVNRASYNTKVSMEMLKESGSLEFGSDVIFGLQLKGVGEKDFDVNVAKNKDPRKVELVILKNRNGSTGDTLSFEYYPKFNYFKETTNEFSKAKGKTPFDTSAMKEG